MFITGMLADFTSNFKAVLVANILLTALSGIAMVHTPVSEPKILTVNFTTGEAGILAIGHQSCAVEADQGYVTDWVRFKLTIVGVF